MRIEILAPAVLADHVAGRVAASLRAAAQARGQATLAVSGGRTPGRLLARLAAQPVPWDRLHVFQVDERVAPDGDPARNLTGLRAALLDHVPLPAAQAHALPVEADDLDAAAAGYADVLRTVAGAPPVLDVVLLGLGSDGHTASLVPGDPAVEVVDREVVRTGTYQGHRRLTLTRPVLDAARERFWLVTGGDKAVVAATLAGGGGDLVAGRLRRDGAVLFLDPPAAAGVHSA
ncbi:6-phosphogluconolactonase [Egicoccus halophilus]|uniref:6-phosphogluconolactonase n=1 Tax=Egicoccus halophilus TaxID=1670830 RepID=A0A8J3EVP8_9ACTN|nr:6-phosphogluconolactonase [Egicoccus halophilus]GGI08586.1 hypothetical protein GCM10011354_29820 [Egicoccus halophilus]